MNWKPINNNYLKILSLDGGGIKGIFEAHYLKLLENYLGEKIYNCFDLITGTSTGGIIALAVSSGMSADEIEKLYVNNKDIIFNTSFIRNISQGIFVSKYTNLDLKNLLIKTFGNLKMKDAKVKLCIPSVSHSKCKTKLYKTPHSKNKSEDDGNTNLWEVALATSSAPIYFNPAIINNEYMLDGGLWANNPSLVAIVEAFKNGYSKDKIKILSIGCGENSYKVKDEKIKNGGLLGYGVNIVDLIGHIQLKSISFMCNQLIDKNILRINFKEKRKLNMDDISDDNIKFLQSTANECFKNTIRNVYNFLYS